MPLDGGDAPDGRLEEPADLKLRRRREGPLRIEIVLGNGRRVVVPVLVDPVALGRLLPSVYPSAEGRLPWWRFGC
jgi:hypothetical protein